WGSLGGIIAMSPARRGCVKCALAVSRNIAANPIARAFGQVLRYPIPAKPSRRDIPLVMMKVIRDAIELSQSRKWLVVNKMSLWLYSSQCLVICYDGAMATKYHHGNLRQEVLAVAAVFKASRGVDALSMRDLTRQAGVSHVAPAHHFC